MPQDNIEIIKIKVSTEAKIGVHELAKTIFIEKRPKAVMSAAKYL